MQKTQQLMASVITTPNPQLGQEDNLFYNALSIDRFMEGFFRGRDLSTNEAQFFRLMRMGILDGREGYDMPMTVSGPLFP